MKIKNLAAALLAALSLLCISCGKSSELYSFKVKTNEGKEIKMSQFKGKVLLIANTASRCGFTPQYKGLEALYEQYKDQGLVVIGFPCDQFGHQEPGSDEEIAQFCSANFGVTFPLMSKIEVNGEAADPLFVWLYTQQPFKGFGEGQTAEFMNKMLAAIDPEFVSNPDIKWNFTKFLVNREGEVVARYEPTVSPEKIEDDIKALL